MWDAKLLRRKGKERHLFLFQQALLVTKEVKDVDGRVVYLYKYKLKVCNSKYKSYKCNVQYFSLIFLFFVGLS